MKAKIMLDFPVIISGKKSKEKLKDLWTTATVIANGKGKITKEKKATYDNKLDKLFDILYCQHNAECTLGCPIFHHMPM